MGPIVAGWTNIALGLLVGLGTTVGFLAGSLGGAESPFFILVACLLVAVGAFVIAVRPVPAAIFGLSLLFLGIFLGFGLLVGGSVFGAADAAVTKAVGVAGILLAALEAWSIFAAWGHRKRPIPAVELPKARDKGESPEAQDEGDLPGNS
jgi:hypothetical protein